MSKNLLIVVQWAIISLMGIPIVSLSERLRVLNFRAEQLIVLNQKLRAADQELKDADATLKAADDKVRKQLVESMTVMDKANSTMHSDSVMLRDCMAQLREARKDTGNGHEN